MGRGGKKTMTPPSTTRAARPEPRGGEVLPPPRGRRGVEQDDAAAQHDARSASRSARREVAPSSRGREGWDERLSALEMTVPTRTSYHVEGSSSALPLLHHHPVRLQIRIRDQPDHRGGGDQQRVVHLPAEEHGERREGDERGEP